MSLVVWCEVSLRLVADIHADEQPSTQRTLAAKCILIEFNEMERSVLI
jgi:hypothetical protein